MPIYLSSNSSGLSNEIACLPESVNAKLDRMSRKLSKYNSKKSDALLPNQPGTSNLFHNPPNNLISISSSSSSSAGSASSSASNSAGINNHIGIALDDNQDHHHTNVCERLRAGKNIKNNRKILLKKPNTMKPQKPKINQVRKRRIDKNHNQKKKKNLSKPGTTKDDILQIIEQAHLAKGYDAVASEYLTKFLIGLFKDSYPNVIKRMKKYQNYWKDQMNKHLADGNVCLYKEYLLPYQNNELLKNCIKTIKENDSKISSITINPPTSATGQLNLNRGDEELLNAIQKQYLKALVI